MLRLVPAGTNAEEKSPGAYLLNGVSHPREDSCRTVGNREHQRPDTNALRARRDRREHSPRLAELPEVVRNVDRVKSGCLGATRQREEIAVLMGRVKTHTHVHDVESNAGRYRQPPFDTAKCVLTASALAGCCGRKCAPSAGVQERFGAGKQVGMHQVDLGCTS